MDASLIYQNLAVLAAFLLIYSLIAGRFESRLINGPLLFLLMGWLLVRCICLWLIPLLRCLMLLSVAVSRSKITETK